MPASSRQQRATQETVAAVVAGAAESTMKALRRGQRRQQTIERGAAGALHQHDAGDAGCSIAARSSFAHLRRQCRGRLGEAIFSHPAFYACGDGASGRIYARPRASPAMSTSPPISPHSPSRSRLGRASSAFSSVGITETELGEHEAHLQRWLDARPSRRDGLHGAPRQQALAPGRTGAGHAAGDFRAHGLPAAATRDAPRSAGRPAARPTFRATHWAATTTS